MTAPHNEPLAIVSFFTCGYNRYFRPFYETVKRHFFPSRKRVFFIFSDNPHIEEPDVVRIPIEGAGYHNGLRHRYITDLRDELAGFRHIVALNGNAMVLQDIHETAHPEDAAFLRPLFGSTTGLAHQSYHAVISAPNKAGYVDRDREDISVYWRGGLWGGDPDHVLGLARDVGAMMEKDSASHDEPYINRFFISHKPEAALLDARYIWSGAWGNNPFFDIRIVMADKRGAYGDLRQPVPSDAMLHAYAKRADAGGPVYIGPGLWKSDVVGIATEAPTPPVPSVAGTSTPAPIASRTLSRLAHDILPPALTRSVQQYRRKKAARQRRRKS